MNGDERLRELTTLKAIAETLNTSLDVRNGLDGALSQLVRLMGLRTGWLFLDEARRFEVGAHEGLPASLTADEHRRLSRGWCQCQDLYRDGELDKAVNIVRCSRLDGGPEDEGLVYHASVPLLSKERMLGILNVAVPGEYLFTETDLALLSAVGYQMGTAIERARLFETERRRSEQLALVNQIGRQITSTFDPERLLRTVAELVASKLDWATVAIALADEHGTLRLRAMQHRGGGLDEAAENGPVDDDDPLRWAVEHQEALLIGDLRAESHFAHVRRRPRSARSILAVPVVLRGATIGAIACEDDRERELTDVDRTLLEFIASDVAVALENIRLLQERRRVAALEERNRLARDLHDSVTQSLFSMTLTAQAARDLLARDPERAERAVEQLQSLSQQTLAEMRDLIFQLRPAALDDGLVAALRRLLSDYRQRTGWLIDFTVTGTGPIEIEVEEELFRIAQESLHNTYKHASARTVAVRLEFGPPETVLTVEDDGRGIDACRKEGRPTLGLTSMAERAQSVGGNCLVESPPKGGTRVTVRVPRERERSP